MYYRYMGYNIYKWNTEYRTISFRQLSVL